MTEPAPLLRPDEAYHAQAIPLKRDRISPLPPVQRNVTTVAVLLSGQPQHCSTWYGGGAAQCYLPAP